MRLRLLEEEYGDRVHMRFKGFLLRPHPQAGRKPGPDHPERWAKIAENGADVGIQFGVYPADRDLPTHSLPGLEAAKCAALQGPEAFRRMDLRLMEAYFGEGRDISDRAVLLELAGESGLDVEKFQESFDSGYRFRMSSKAGPYYNSGDSQKPGIELIKIARRQMRSFQFDGNDVGRERRGDGRSPFRCSNIRQINPRPKSS